MGVLKSFKKKDNGKGDGSGKAKEEYDEQGMKKPIEETHKKERKEYRIRRLHVYSHAEKHGRKEPLRAHPHHLRKKEKEEEGEGEEEITETHEAEVDEETKEHEQKKQKEEEDEILDMSAEEALAKFKTTEAGLPEVHPYFLFFFVAAQMSQLLYRSLPLPFLYYLLYFFIFFIFYFWFNISLFREKFKLYDKNTAKMQ